MLDKKLHKPVQKNKSVADRVRLLSDYPRPIRRKFARPQLETPKDVMVNAGD